MLFVTINCNDDYKLSNQCTHIPLIALEISNMLWLIIHEIEEKQKNKSNFFIKKDFNNRIRRQTDDIYFLKKEI